MSQSLYKIADSVRNVLELRGEVPDEAIADTLEALDMEFNDKLDAVLAYRQSLVYTADNYDSEVKRLQELKKANQNKAERLKEYAISMMDIVGKTKHTGLFTVSIGKPSQQVIINDLESLPEEFLIIKKDASKTKIKQAIEQGLEVSGASIQPGNRRILIK